MAVTNVRKSRIIERTLFGPADTCRSAGCERDFQHFTQLDQIHHVEVLSAMNGMCREYALSQMLAERLYAGR